MANTDWEYHMNIVQRKARRIEHLERDKQQTSHTIRQTVLVFLKKKKKKKKKKTEKKKKQL